MGKCVRFLVIRNSFDVLECFTVMLSTFTAVVTIHLLSVEVFWRTAFLFPYTLQAGYLTIIMLVL